MLALFCYDWKKIKFGAITVYLPKKAGLALPNLFTEFGISEYDTHRLKNRHNFSAWEIFPFCYFCFCFFKYWSVQHVLDLGADEHILTAWLVSEVQ